MLLAGRYVSQQKVVISDEAVDKNSLHGASQK